MFNHNSQINSSSAIDAEGLARLARAGEKRQRKAARKEEEQRAEAARIQAATAAGIAREKRACEFRLQKQPEIAARGTARRVGAAMTAVPPVDIWALRAQAERAAKERRLTELAKELGVDPAQERRTLEDLLRGV